MLHLTGPLNDTCGETEVTVGFPRKQGNARAPESLLELPMSSRTVRGSDYPCRYPGSCAWAGARNMSSSLMGCLAWEGDPLDLSNVPTSPELLQDAFLQPRKPSPGIREIVRCLLSTCPLTRNSTHSTVP